MKRRNIDAGKFPRRSTKRNTKFSDNVYGNLFVYLKFVGIWLLILLADFILEFRFEYLWPVWLLAQSVYETFKYQGLIYAVFFICIAITTDTICVLLLPIHYLFLLASTYVWIHYIWHTDKGFCMPTVCLWTLFMYVEVTQRLHDLKVGQFHTSLCQPFAAHCIGHPIVTLGISFKSYVFYRIKLRTQRQVRKENIFHFELLKQALPIDLQHNHVLSVTDQAKNDGMHHCNGFVSHQCTSSKKHSDKTQKSSQDLTVQSTVADVPTIAGQSKQHFATTNSSNSPVTQRKLSSKETISLNSSKSVSEIDADFFNSLSSDTELRKRNPSFAQNKKSTSSCTDTSTTSNAQTIKNSYKSGSSELSSKSHKATLTQKQSQGDNSKPLTTGISTSLVNLCKETSSASTAESNSKIELISTSSTIEQLEATISKLKAELASVQKSNVTCKTQLDQITTAERNAKSELAYLKRDHESLQMKFNTLVSHKEKDKLDLQSLEKRLKAETDYRESTEKLLQEEKRRRKEDEATANITLSNRDKESAEVLKVIKIDLEEKINILEKQLNEKDLGCKKLESKLKVHQAREKSIKESETLMSALEAMKEKNVLLEKSLSAETRLKLDLFSALGDAKRQLELAHGALFKRDSEISELKVRLSDLLSILPEQRQLRSSTPHYSANFLEKAPPLLQLASPQEYPAPYCPPPPTPIPAPIIQAHPTSIEQNIHMQPIHLDPNAAIYTPATTSV